jgi:hypothetical protein
MRYTKDIFDILSRGGFISQNSVSQQISNLYDAIEDDFQQYQDYFSGIGFLLEGGNGYYYFSRSENKVELADKVQRMAEWIDRIDFLKTFNTAFGSGFTFSKSNILEQFYVNNSYFSRIRIHRLTHTLSLAHEYVIVGR